MEKFFDSELCARCKGRGWCGKPCEILAKIRTRTIELNKPLRQKFEGVSPPTVFIGSKLTYPTVNVGIMSLQEKEEDAWIYDSPNYWSSERINSKEIIRFRKSLVNSRFQAKVFDVRKNKRLLNIVQEIGMASLQSDVEIKLNKKPKNKINFDPYLLPMGPAAQLKSIKIVSNSKIPSFIDKVYFDSDLKSAEGIRYLYKKGLDEHSLSQILSIGITGLKKNRKLVPTRSSITAIDGTLGKHLIKKIRDYKMMDNYKIHFGGHLGNYYLILFFPDIFSYELFETVFPKTTWNPFPSSRIQIMTDYENYKGRKNYAEETAGGYYAARLPILEHLENIKRQASALVLRFVLPEYDVPLGVWVCRNSTRKALSSPPVYFKSKKEMLKYTEGFIKETLKFDISGILNQSKMLKEMKNQMKLSQYF